VQGSSSIALDARGVSKSYGDRTALQRVDLVVPSGGLHGLLGANGAGKTTLLRVLLGLVRPDAGAIRLLGRQADATRAGASVPDGVAGFVETTGFYPYLSGRRNLELVGRLDGTSGAKAAAGRALDQVGLTAQAESRVAGYSAGMRQRLGLASALMRSPRLLLLDEPTSSLDPAGARAVRAVIRRLADEGTAVVLSSHDMYEVEALCTTLTVLDHGRVMFAGAADQLRRLAPDSRHLLRTSDDAAAFTLAENRPGVTVAFAGDGSGLDVAADVADLDRYVIALAGAGIAVRGLEPRARSLETLFLNLTGGDSLNTRLAPSRRETAAPSAAAQ